MGCTTCNSKGCRTNAKDCFDVKELSISKFQDEKIASYAKSASLLIDNGRAGTLSRSEEVIEYILDQGYEKVGVAYCFGLPDHARELEKLLLARQIKPVMVQCTAGGVLESQIDSSKDNTVTSCNPVGQALTLEKKGAEFVIEMGLCMGHDVILHEHMNLPHTTILVKDRVFNHNPGMALPGHKDGASQFLEEMDDNFHMVSTEWLDELRHIDMGMIIVDLRSPNKFNEAHIPGSVQVNIKELPARISEIAPDKRQKIVMVCNGAMQSAYTLPFLSSRGYRDIHNLGGGFSKWVREKRETVSVDSIN